MSTSPSSTPENNSTTGSDPEYENLTEEQIKKLKYEDLLIHAGIVQLIDQDGTFTDRLPEYLKKTGLINKKNDYSILAVFGPQSSGKSTLLNRLFRTHFPIMNNEQGRYQVTKGVVASRGKESNILVLDIEGTDSKERGEENVSFERKISLFALAMSEVLIVNMWVQDIGRYNASNYSLLKTVFELNLQLFQKNNNNKTLLLFVIRDHIAQITPLELLRKQIFEDIDKIWSSIIKPEDFKSTKVTDFFDVEFTSLPHKILQVQEFDTACEKLRDKFYDGASTEFVFRPSYKKSVPIDAFQLYANNVWQTIVQNKDLDIPNQKEMVTLYRCNEISKEVFEEFDQVHHQWITSVRQNKKFIEKFGNTAYLLIQKVLENFKSQTNLYVPKVVTQKVDELELKMKDATKQVFEGIVQLAKTKAVEVFQKFLQAQIISLGVLYEFYQTIDTVMEKVNPYFEDHVQQALLPMADASQSSTATGFGPGHEEYMKQWLSYAEQLRSELHEDIQKYVAEVRKQQIDAAIEEEKKEAISDLNTAITPILTEAPVRTTLEQTPTSSSTTAQQQQGMWEQLRAVRDELISNEKENLKNKLQGFNVTEEELQAYYKQIDGLIDEQLRLKVEELLPHLSFKMLKRFDDKFKYTAGNIPRTWRNENDIKKAYKIARAQGLQLLDLFFLFRLNKEEYDQVSLFISTPEDPYELAFRFPRTMTAATAAASSMASSIASAAGLHPTSPVHVKRLSMRNNSVSFQEIVQANQTPAPTINEDDLLMNEVECRGIYETFLLKSESTLNDALRQQLLQQNNTKIPLWIFALIGVLGFDEFMYFLTRPHYLIIGALLFGIFGWSYVQSYVADFLATGNPAITVPLRMALEKLPLQLNLQPTNNATSPATTTTTSATSPVISAPVMNNNNTTTTNALPEVATSGVVRRRNVNIEKIETPTAEQQPAKPLEQ